MDPTAAHSIVATRVSNVAQGSQVCTKSLPWGNFLDPSNHSFEAPIKISDVDYEDASQEYYVHTLVGYYVGHITSKTWFGFGYMKLKSIRLACCQYQKPDQGFLHVVHIKNWPRISSCSNLEDLVATSPSCNVVLSYVGTPCCFSLTWAKIMRFTFCLASLPFFGSLLEPLSSI